MPSCLPRQHRQPTHETLATTAIRWLAPSTKYISHSGWSRFSGVLAISPTARRARADPGRATATADAVAEIDLENPPHRVHGTSTGHQPADSPMASFHAAGPAITSSETRRHPRIPPVRIHPITATLKVCACAHSGSAVAARVLVPLSRFTAAPYHRATIQRGWRLDDSFANCARCEGTWLRNSAIA